jgi:hypothetical protein
VQGLLHDPQSVGGAHAKLASGAYASKGIVVKAPVSLPAAEHWWPDDEGAVTTACIDELGVFKLEVCPGDSSRCQVLGDGQLAD